MVHGFDWGPFSGPFFPVFGGRKCPPPGGRKVAPQGPPFPPPHKGSKKTPKWTPKTTPKTTQKPPPPPPLGAWGYRSSNPQMPIATVARRERGIQRIFTSVARATSFRHNVSGPLMLIEDAASIPRLGASYNLSVMMSTAHRTMDAIEAAIAICTLVRER